MSGYTGSQLGLLEPDQHLEDQTAAVVEIFSICLSFFFNVGTLQRSLMPLCLCYFGTVWLPALHMCQFRHHFRII